MTEHDERQDPSKPVGPEHVDDPTEGEHLASPEPGHPAGETEPTEGLPERVHEHPEDIGETPSDEEGAESVTQSPAPEEDDSLGAAARPHEVAHAAMRGAIAAMAMSGVRAFTVDLGIVKQTPPQAIVKQRARALLRRVPPRRRGAAVELAHWSYGAGGGAAFALLPEGVRRRAWAGPAYGLAVWLAFEAAIAPTLGLTQAKRLRVAERLALAADHLLYGLVLSETRRRARE